MGADSECAESDTCASGAIPRVSDDRFARIAAGVYPGAVLKAQVRLVGGVSASVHRLDLNLDGGRTTSVVLRAHRLSRSGHAVEREYRLLQALHRRGLPVPEPLLIDTSAELVPGPFLVMAFVAGTTALPGARRRGVGGVAGSAPRADRHRLPEITDAAARRLLAGEPALAERRPRRRARLGGRRPRGSTVGRGRLRGCSHCLTLVVDWNTVPILTAILSAVPSRAATWCSERSRGAEHPTSRNKHLNPRDAPALTWNLRTPDRGPARAAH